MLQYIKPTTTLQIHRILERTSTSDLTEMILHLIMVEVRNNEIDPEEEKEEDDDDDDTGFTGPPWRLTCFAIDSVWRWV
ncbi:LOW QUALITY PROTEIN: hypothetical protein TorRG33x02_008140 [Trema orientale]|uniref:Uncharacterized protein n=1 Tax=Trema orientale TaxID=63057 RepID=A0A2P5G0R7_TREOI|nr:LOW QUALITY PROTEIN: hypothetical protein TorRG33x02_008140 [Trema orientale]